MYMKKILLITLCSTITRNATLNRIGLSQQNNLGIFDDQGDVGNPIKPGSVSYDPVSQKYTMEGAG